MPGLGRLRATREGTIFFIPDEDLDIYCSGFGLQPVSLKTHEETPEEVARAVSDLRKMVDDPVPPLKPLPETGQEEAVGTEPEPVSATEPASRPEPVAPDPASPASVEDSPAGPSAPVAAASTQDLPAAPATPVEYPTPAVQDAPAAPMTPVEFPTPAAQDTPAAPASPDAPAASAYPDQSATQVSPAPSGNVRKKRLLTGVAVVIFIALLALGGFILLSRLSPDLVDRMLYSEDELRLIERFEHYR